MLVNILSIESLLLVLPLPPCLPRGRGGVKQGTVVLRVRGKGQISTPAFQVLPQTPGEFLSFLKGGCSPQGSSEKVHIYKVVSDERIQNITPKRQSLTK